jgi:hypothetical protein
MIGSEPQEALSKSAAWKELHSLVVLEDVKESIKTFFYRTLSKQVLEMVSVFAKMMGIFNEKDLDQLSI